MDDATLKTQVDRYFAGDLDTAASRALFDALDEHPAVADYFAARQTFARLDPKGGNELDRIGQSLGLAAPKRNPLRWLAPSFGLAAAAAATLLFVVPTPQGNDGEFAARGVAATSAVTVLKVGANPGPLDDTLRADDELAFAYQTSAPGYLAIFAVDEADRVYWYYPAWTDAAEVPRAVRVMPSDRPVELPEAVRHPLRPGALRLFAVFLSKPLSTRDIETSLPPGAVDASALPFAESVSSWQLVVR